MQFQVFQSVILILSILHFLVLIVIRNAYLIQEYIFQYNPACQPRTHSNICYQQEDISFHFLLSYTNYRFYFEKLTKFLIIFS